MNEHPAAAAWAVIEALPDGASERSEKAWRSILAPLVTAVGEAPFASSFADAFNAAVGVEMFEAFYLFTNHVDSEYFANFVAALMLRGKGTFERCLADPEELARRGLPNDLHHEGEDFLVALLESIPDLELDLDGCARLSQELMERIHAVEVKAKDGFRARIPEVESENGYRFRKQDWIYRSMLAGRWPELARASATPPAPPRDSPR